MTSSARKSLIFISYYYPPSTQMAARRAEQLAGYLAQRGWSVHVVTTSAPHALDAAGNPKITRLRDPLARVTERAQATDATAKSARADWRSAGIRLGRAIVPFDSSVLWNLSATRFVRHLLAKDPPSIVITSAPPFATTLAGALTKSHRPTVRWVHELRDLVATNPIYGWGHLRRWINFRLERTLLRRADGVVFLTEEIEKTYRRNYGLSAPGVVAYNGFQESFADAIPPHAPASGRLRLLHVGSFYGSRNPRAFLAGVRRALDQKPDAEKKLRITFVGQLGQTPTEVETVRRQLEALRLNDVVQVIPPIAHAKLLELYRDADVLVLITHGDGTSSYAIPGKLFEYIGARRKIFAVTSDSLPRKIVEENDFGWVCPHDDAAVARILLKLLQQPESSWQLDVAKVERFSFRHQAASVEALLEASK